MKMENPTPEELAEAAKSWRLEKVDSQRWKVVNEDGTLWAPMPRAVYHSQLQAEVVYEAMMAPRAIAQEALDHFQRGERAPLYIQTGKGLVRPGQETT